MQENRKTKPHLIGACSAIEQQPAAFAPDKHGSLYPTASDHGCLVAIHVNAYAIMSGREVVESPVGNGSDVVLLGLSHASHVYENKLWRMNLVERGSVFVDHCLAHAFV